MVPNIMNFDSFATNSLYFHHHLVFQGVSDFVRLERPFYPNLIKVFYLNLRILANGHLESVVDEKRIKLIPLDWLNVAYLKYES